MLKRLEICKCDIEQLENDLFSNLQQLSFLNLSYNRIHHIEENAFLKLKNLQILNLCFNKLNIKK